MPNQAPLIKKTEVKEKEEVELPFPDVVGALEEIPFSIPFGSSRAINFLDHFQFLLICIIIIVFFLQQFKDLVSHKRDSNQPVQLTRS